MPQLHQSTGIATGGFDALDQLQRATENLLVGRLREYTGSGLRTEVENLHEIAIPAHSALAYRCCVHAFPSESKIYDTDIQRLGKTKLQADKHHQ